ncbi:hypothetical protein CC80DRAFT_505376 [Byssothecium circinans]|uniref:Kelch repeat protein-like protein n=1 Tax=Byssothecium circinans TaxID=147558 RepID=A0A6A5TS41_9PLEO|nr:hypothetical protein CC80DRAFT_505376 [Byssothecium circinans]
MYVLGWEWYRDHYLRIADFTTPATSATVPRNRHFCAVAASSPDNSSQNIYLYGWESQSGSPNAEADIWILSIQSFRWIKVNVESLPRKAQGYTTLANGKYMLVHGGIKAGFGNEGNSDECDPQRNGLRLFDLSSLTWTETYKGLEDGHGYKVPKIVQDAIGDNAMGNSTQTAPSAGFETPALASLFQKSTTTSTPPLSGPPSTSSKTDTDTSASTKPTTIGAIAGGVVGGVLAIVLLVVGALFLKRRNNRSAQKGYAAYGTTLSRQELSGQPGTRGELNNHSDLVKELESPKPVYEMWAEHDGAGQASPYLPQTSRERRRE